MVFRVYSGDFIGRLIVFSSGRHLFRHKLGYFKFGFGQIDQLKIYRELKLIREQ